MTAAREIVDLVWSPGRCWCGCGCLTRRPADRFWVDHQDVLMVRLLESPSARVRLRLTPMALGSVLCSPDVVAAVAFSPEVYEEFRLRCAERAIT